MKRDDSQTTEPRLFPERRLTPRWQQLAAGHQIKRRFILSGQFQTLHDQLAHERSEIGRRKFGPYRPDEPDYGYGRIPLRLWSRRTSAWRDVA
jgi:hypothetical protein